MDPPVLGQQYFFLRTNFSFEIELESTEKEYNANIECSWHDATRRNIHMHACIPIFIHTYIHTYTCIERQMYALSYMQTFEIWMNRK